MIIVVVIIQIVILWLRFSRGKCVQEIAVLYMWPYSNVSHFLGYYLWFSTLLFLNDNSMKCWVTIIMNSIFLSLIWSIIFYDMFSMNEGFIHKKVVADENTA